ncbi:winged helix-turn-helix domain-containing protein [Streptomyces scopuliridis]|uniref:AfsR/SARP family transcriptional regulator n=1 Tax=Streptomyces scopuliridis TaxID=452529 RepID=UPI002DDA2C57|nr:BTAD domain-containing putative transcriptional regulator [Streptomyces scopuliridis]WSB38155.1 winged helix-turn-helix domain-containing protein [Streptomyces scopuliridis]
MRFQLLGPLSIAEGHDVVVLKPSKPSSLLAALLIHPGSVVSTGYLLRALWDEDQPATARAALQSCVLRLRRLFVKYGVTCNVIEAVPGGYRMNADADTLDLVRFRALVRAADDADDAEGELYRLKEALTLWQGPLLANVPSPMLHRDEVPGLTEERLRTLERACDIELALGRCRQVLVDLWEAARRHPGRERFSEQLIEALYRTGRQSEALSEYRSVKGRLKEELGVDPGPSLQRLELSILRGDDLGPPALDPGLDRTAPLPGGRTAVALAPRTEPLAIAAPAPAPAPVPSVPLGPAMRPVPPVPSFTGRIAERAAITARLAAGSPYTTVVVLSGAPGIGKTALARQAAHDTQDSFPGGVFILAMTREDGSSVTPAEALAYLPPPGTADGATLLVLDDVTSPDQVRPLLPARPGSAAIVTSRRGLAGLMATHGGSVHRLSTLEPAESEQLLAAVLGAERVAAEPAAARELARVCGHFPLSLRIATARLLTRPGLRIEDCVAWLSEDLPARLSLADDPRLSVPQVFGGALRRLEPRWREAFHRLGDHEGLLLSSQALGNSPEAEEALERLADAGLLEEGPPGPYRIHRLLKIYARQQARERHNSQAATARH